MNDFAKSTAQATELAAQIAANSRRADVLDEQYLQAKRAAAAAEQKVAATEQKISSIDARARRLREQLGRRSARLYIGRGSSGPLGLNVANVEDLGSMAQYGDAAAAHDEGILDELNRVDAQLEAERDNVESQLAAARDRQRDARDKRREVARINASMQKLLDSTNANVKLLAARLEQQGLAAAAVAGRAWLKRLAAQRAADQSHTPGADSPGNIPAPTAGALTAVAYAQAQLGKPYVYAAAGPDAFDCSGLTMMAWAQSGVLMTHGSQAQYNAFPHVPIDQLQPGDLVFFGTSGPTNHHVGIVVGPGIMIDAPHTGAYVEIATYFRPDLVLTGARP